MRIGYVEVGMSDRRPELLVKGVQGRILGKILYIYGVQKGLRYW